jgi:hypothetical protein
MRQPDAGTTVGRCTFCKDYIIEGMGNRSKYATIRGGHWLCGDCIISLKDVVISAFFDYHKEADEKKKDMLTKLKKYGWSVDPETGKLQKL